NKTILKLLVRHQVFRHSNREQTHRAITHESVGGACNSENRRKVARRGIEDGLRKQKRPGGLRARLDDIAVKALCVNHAAVRDCDDYRDSVAILQTERHSRILQRLQTCGGGEARNRTGAAQAWMRRQLAQRGFVNSESAVGSIAKLFRHFFRGRLMTMEELLPYRINAVSERCNPPHTGDC